MVVGETKRANNIMEGIENTGDVRLHDHRLRLKQRFDIVRKLGQGTYGKVQLGINKKTGQEVAIKTIKKCKIESEADLVRIRREVQIMSSVRHPNIVHIYEVFENSEKMILVMEYCSGGELYDYLSQKKVLQEEEAKRLFRQIATAVYYCHIHKICHRDLKLENVLLDDTGSAKIADFGLSNVFKETSLLATFCGSPLYASPEIVKGTPYIGPEVDCWSLGVLLYTLVYGAMPFDGSNFKRLVRQISNGDYYEPKTPSTASPLIRDMLTVDPLKRADITYICDHAWVNTGYDSSCLEEAEALAAQTPVRLDLLLSLAPAAPNNTVVVPDQAELGAEDSGTDLTTSASMAVEPSNSAEKRILDLVAEGGEDAIKPSPTRTIVSGADGKRKLELAMSASGMQRKKERVASAAHIPPEPAAEQTTEDTTEPPAANDTEIQPCLKSSATITIAPSATIELIPSEPPKPDPPQEEVKEKAKPRVVIKKKVSPPKVGAEKVTANKEEIKQEETKPASVSSAADKLTSLSLAPPAAVNQTPAEPKPKPKKLSIPGGNVGSFKEQFERRASLTNTPEVKRNVSKPVVSKIAKPKAQSEDRDLTPKVGDTASVRLQQIGIEPSPSPPEEQQSGVKKTESEPSHSSTTVDPSVLLQDARRSLQNSMAKLVEEKTGEENRRRAARDIISTAIRTGKPPVPYGRSSSAGVASLSPPGTPPTPTSARTYRTEATHRVRDHRDRGVSVERIIPIQVTEEGPGSPETPVPVASIPVAITPVAINPVAITKIAPPPPKFNQVPLRRLVSSDSNSESCASPSGEPIKKSAREFIIPIAVEGKGFVTPRQRSAEPEKKHRHRRISSLVSGGESEEEDESHMHRLRSSRLARAESVSSGEEEEDDEGFHLLTAENLFSTLLHRVRSLTNRLNGEEGPGFPQQHSLFNNLQSPFFNSSPLARRHNALREGWGSRDLQAEMDSMFSKRQPFTRGGRTKGGKRRQEDGGSASASDLSELDLSGIRLSEAEAAALSGLTPALARRLQRQLFAHLPAHAANHLRRTLSLQAPAQPAPDAALPRRRQPDTLPRRRDPDADSLPKRSDPDADTTPRSRDPDADENTLPRRRNPDADTLPRRREPDPDDRPLLSKYLTPERDDSFSSDGGSILSEPSYVAAYGRRARADRDATRRRVSRFLRPDFFDAPPDESVFLKHKKERELETQEVLREIREKKSKTSEGSPSPRSPSEAGPVRRASSADVCGRRCFSPVGASVVRERSRSNTPFYPILDNIRESAMDSSQKYYSDDRRYNETADTLRSQSNETSFIKDSRLIRPKSYPVKNDDQIKGEINGSKGTSSKDELLDIKDVTKESKLLRPRSYPASSPSPEKTYVNTKGKRNESQDIKQNNTENKSDVEVTFHVSLPKKNKPKEMIPDPYHKEKSIVDRRDVGKNVDNSGNVLTLKKYEIENKNPIPVTESLQKNNVTTIANGKSSSVKTSEVNNKDDSKNNSSNSENTNSIANKDDNVLKPNTEIDKSEKKPTIKKKIIRKVSSKTKADSVDNNEKSDPKTTDKKKVIKKLREKINDDIIKNNENKKDAVKKKSVLQSIGQKFEKFTSAKSSSLDKDKSSAGLLLKKEASKKDSLVSSGISRNKREQSVPAQSDLPTESNLIKRAVTLTDVAALENQTAPPNKTTVSKVLGLFKKFDSKEKVNKIDAPKISMETSNNVKTNVIPDIMEDKTESDKPKRPTSLLLNGLGRKYKYGKTSSDSVSVVSMPNCTSSEVNDKKDDSKNLRNSLNKLDLSRLPRVKKIVPTNPVIEPQIVNLTYNNDKETDVATFNKNIKEPVNEIKNLDIIANRIRSRSRSKSDNSHSESKSDNQTSEVDVEKSNNDITSHQPLRNHEPTTPEKEDIGERIRRKSFYTRFNEKRQRRKSNLVGPGAAEYDPVARLHSQPGDSKHDISPTSSVGYDLSPGFSSAASDLSPSTERYRSLNTELPLTARNTSRFDSYGGHDKIDSYRSLDRSDLRKYSNNRSYTDYEPPSIYGNRYARTLSLLDNADGNDDSSSYIREPHKYSRTLSLYAPGSYATYRPKRVRNSAIILKESEKEPSPENILDKIRQKKISISVTRKLDPDKESQTRSNVSSKSEGDGPERTKEVD